MIDPEFTVVIPCYNREKTLKTAVRSVQRQTYPHWKLLLIDDGSTDDSAKLIPFLAEKDTRIRFKLLEKNRGISQVLNVALENVDTPYFVQLDSDDGFHQDTLKTLANAIRKADPRTGLFYANVKIVQKFNGRWRLIRRVRHRPFDNKYDFLQYMTYMLHPRCYRTEAVRSVNGWDTDDAYQGRIMEDRRMCLKIINRYPVYWINRYLYFRRKHNGQLTDRESLHKRNDLRKQITLTSLYQWGNRYQPVFGYKNGWLIIRQFQKRKDRRGEWNG